jgi:hypothetical protein
MASNATYIGGLKVGTTSNAIERVGDVVIYSGGSNQSIRIGHRGAEVTSMEVRSNSDLLMGADLYGNQMQASYLEMRMGDVTSMGAPSEVMTALAYEAGAASNHTFLMGEIGGIENWTAGIPNGMFSVKYNASNSVFGSNVTVLGPTQLSNLDVQGNLTVYGTTEFVGPFSFNDLTVAGTTDLQGPVTLSNVTITGTADLQGPFSLCNITVTNASHLNTLAVSGATSLSNDLVVYGKTSLSNNAFMSSNLTVLGATSLSNNVNVYGQATFSSNLRVLGSLETTTINYAYSNVTTYTSEQVNSNLTVLGSTNLSSNLNVSGPTTLNVASAIDLTVNNVTAMLGNATVYGGFTAAGIATLNSNLTVYGPTSLQGPIALSNAVTAYGAATFNDRVTLCNIAAPGPSTVMTNSSGLSALGVRADGTTYISSVAPNILTSGDNTAIPATGSNARPLYLFGSNISYESRFGPHWMKTRNVQIGGATLAASNVLTVVGNASIGALYSNVPAPANSLIVSSNVGIGTSNPQFPLHVLSTGSNNISIFSAGDISALSDARLKTDVRVIENALDKMDAVHGYTFRWVRDAETSGQRSAGVIAQEVEQVLPEVVNVDPITGDRHVAYANMSALLIQAIKELKDRVARLEAQ